MTRWRDRIGARLDAIRQRRPLAVDPHARRADARGRPRRPADRVVRLQRLPRAWPATRACRGRARTAIARWGTGSGASRLVVGGRPVHDELEAELADWKGTEAALLLPTGFAANLAVLATLADSPDVLVVSDELNHASIIDGARLVARPRRRRPPRRPGPRRRAARRPRRPGARRHRHGVLDGRRRGPGRRRWPRCAGATARCSSSTRPTPCSAPTVDAPDVDVVRVGTLSKTLGSLGGFVAADREVVDLLVNAARPFIFTTAPTPGDTAAALAALRIVRSAEGARARRAPARPRRRGRARAPVADRPGGPRRRGGGAGRRRPASSSRACSSPPSARRPSRPAPAGSASRCRPPTPTSRSSGW